MTHRIPLHLHHDHGEDSGHGHVHGENTISHTAWTESCEWFVEIEMPIEGHDVCFAAHVTLLKDFQPADSGTFRVEAHSGSETAETAADAPARPGIFTPAIRFPRAGEWTLKLLFENAGLEDSIEWPITVHTEESHPEPEAEEEGWIAFLKEEQWKVSFNTAWPEVRKTGDGESCLLIPAAALVENQGGKAVFVQVNGESFDRRAVETGSSEGGKVEILSGIDAGERIVILGAERLQE
jgi:hypothetical protein